MNSETIREAFSSVLEDDAEPEVIHAFRNGLEADPELDTEFERFAEARINARVHDVRGLLHGLSMLPLPDTSRLAAAIQAETRSPMSRTPLLRRWAPVFAAAAAVIVIVLIAYPRPVEPEISPGNDNVVTPAQTSILFSDSAVFATLDPECLLDGRVDVQVPAGSVASIRAPQLTFTMIGPGAFQLEATAQLAPAIETGVDINPIKTYGTAGVDIQLIVLDGQVEIHSDDEVQVVESGQSRSFSTRESDESIRARFDSLDLSGDGRLDATEIEPALFKLMAQSGEKYVKYSGFKKGVTGISKSNNQNGSQSGNNHQHGNQDHDDEDNQEQDD